MSIQRSPVSILFHYDTPSGDRFSQIASLVPDSTQMFLSQPFVALGLSDARPDLFEGVCGSVRIERSEQKQAYTERLGEAHWFRYLGDLDRRDELGWVLNRIACGEEFMPAMASQMHQVLHVACHIDGKVALDIWAMAPGDNFPDSSQVLLMSDVRMHDDRFEDGREEPPPFTLSRFVDGELVESHTMGIGTWTAYDGEESFQDRVEGLAKSVLLNGEDLVAGIRAIEEVLGPPSQQWPTP